MNIEGNKLIRDMIRSGISITADDVAACSSGREPPSLLPFLLRTMMEKPALSSGADGKSAVKRVMDVPVPESPGLRTLDPELRFSSIVPDLATLILLYKEEKGAAFLMLPDRFMFMTPRHSLYKTAISFGTGTWLYGKFDGRGVLIKLTDRSSEKSGRKEARTNYMEKTKKEMEEWISTLNL